MEFRKTWTELKTIIADKGLSLQSDESDIDYVLDAIDGLLNYRTILLKDGGADVVDFENNFKADANQPSNALVTKLFTAGALADGVYEDSKIVVTRFANKTFNVKNIHPTGGLKYKVWASPDNSEWEEIVSETPLAALAKASFTNNDYWKYVKLSAKGDGSASTIDAFVQVGP